MTAAPRHDEPLFECALPGRVQLHLRLVTPNDLRVRRRMLIAILIGWLPLFVLAAGQTLLGQTNTLASLLWEVGAHARYLLAVPILIFAEAASAPHLNAVVHHFSDSGIVETGGRRGFNAAVESTRRLLVSPLAETCIVALAYLVVVATMLSHHLDELPLWARPTVLMPRYSAAGWWHMLVSLPVMLILIFGWFWRLLLWARLLWMISRLGLRLVASHPDHCAGLAFLGHSVRAFATAGLALAVIAAGRSAHEVLETGGFPTSYLYFNIGFLAAIAVIFVAPLLVFTGPLFEVWRHGTFAYDALAARVGLQFEHEWLTGAHANRKALDRPDFSATADLYGVVSNVHSMRFVPLDIKDLIALAVSLLLPFLPVLLLSVPLDVIWHQIKSLLL